MSAVTLQFSPLHSALSSQGGVLDVVVRIQAADAPAHAAASQPPKRLALVVDRSGSMSGQPLAEALRCVEHIAARLGPQDQLAVLAYDNEVQTLQPLAPVNLPTLKASLATVTEGGSTDLFAGWQAGAKALDDGPANAISRVLLLSDGCANHGLTEPEDILPAIARSADQGIATTTVGLGRGFNEALMIAMARTGRGQQYYGQCATDLYDGFDEELQLLQALCLRRLTLTLVPADGVTLQPLGVFDRLPDGRFQLPDLPWGAEAWVAVRLHHTAAQGAADTDSLRTLLAATLDAATLDGQPLTQHAPPLQLPTLSPEACAQLPAEPQVATRLDEARFAHDSQLLAQLLSKGQRTQARALLQDMQQRHAHHPWLAAKLQRLAVLAERDEDLYRKEAHFNSRRTGQRLTAREDTAFTGDETNSTVPAYLRKKTQEGQGRNH
jgi:Ca-activated chloride channel family protein